MLPVPLMSTPEFRARRVQNWLVLGLMYGFFYMSRYNFSAVQTAVTEQFGWSHKDFGYITGTAQLVYGLAVFLNGPLADRIGGKRAILIGAAGAAFFNFLVGMCHLLIVTPAVVKGGQLVSPPSLLYGMSSTSAVALFAVIWACNHYFQSFGALSIVKINAAWFHVTERGRFAGIFGIMIQLGRFLAFRFGPTILLFLPWQYVFWIPATVLTVMLILASRAVEDSPGHAGFGEFDTGDTSAEEAREKVTLRFVLRKVFARRASWIIALSSMCIGMVRNAVDHWFPRYFTDMFHIPSKSLGSVAAYSITTWAMPLAAILGGLAAGNASDRIFGARRAPVIFFAFIGQGICLVLLRGAIHHIWFASLTVILISFFIQSAHSLVGGAASMDFGGRKAVATAAGLFDGAQYLAGAIMSVLLGRLLQHFKVPGAPGEEFTIWPLVPIPFAILGALLISRLWHAGPGRKGH